MLQQRCLYQAGASTIASVARLVEAAFLDLCLGQPEMLPKSGRVIERGTCIYVSAEFYDGKSAR